MKSIKLSIFCLLLFSILQLSLQAQNSLKTSTDNDYYSSVDTSELTGNELKVALHDLISSNVTQLSYSEVWDALKTTDEDPDNSDNVILLYTGWSYPKTDKGGDSDNWNREHTWAKSMGDFGTSIGPGTDIHHLRPTDVTVNSKRGNLMFDDSENGTEYYDTSKYDETSGTSFDSGCSYDSDSWEPRDAVKGDVARMLFYMAVRYEDEDGYDLELSESSSSSGLHGKLTTLLEWNKEDPVDEWEQNRNDKIYAIQGNRNPFIDNSGFATKIWGDGTDYEDVDEEDDDTATDDPNQIFYEDFETTTLDQMSEYDVTGTTSSWAVNSYDNNYFAKINGYVSGTTYANEDWLINTSPISLSNRSDAYLSFITMMNSYGDNTTFSVLISTDYDGVSDPNNYTWTDLTSYANLSTGSYTSTESGSIDISNWLDKSVYIAFRFINTAESSNICEVDDILITGTSTTTGIEENKENEISIYPNPATDQLNIITSSTNGIANIKIFSISGDLITSINNYNTTEPINIESLQNGVYLLFLNNESQLNKVIKFIKM